MSSHDTVDIAIDLTSGERAAATCTEGIFSILRDIEAKLASQNPQDPNGPICEFHSYVLARYLGFIAARIGPKATLHVLEASSLIVQELTTIINAQHKQSRGKPH